MANRGCLAGLGRMLRDLGGGTRAATPLRVRPRFCVRDDFMSPAELSFYHVLRQRVGDAYVICPKVSLGDLFFAVHPDRRVAFGMRNRIDRKHADLVICDPLTLRPLGAIELDDSSHARTRRRQRDRLVDEVFAVAGLPLVRVPVRRGYTAADVERVIARFAWPNASPAPEAAPETAAPPAPAAPPTAGEPQAPDVAEGWWVSVEGTRAPDRAASAEEAQQAAAEVPACPACGTPMVLRTARRGSGAGGQFWGCPHYPRCRGIRPRT